MGILDRITGFFARKPTVMKGWPGVTSRVSYDEERSPIAQMDAYMRSLNAIAAKFPFEFYEIVDNITMLDPYVSRFVHTTIALGNSGHSLELNASSEARANEAIEAANSLAARCFPLAGGMDGLVSGLFSQTARSGGLCVEWVPTVNIAQIDRAYLVPIKTVRFRYGADQKMELCQLQDGLVTPLNPTQTAFHNIAPRDSNPYPIPPAIAALESCATHRVIMGKIRDWMDKVSALGVLLATVEPPPREPGESQTAYDLKAQAYLDKIAAAITDNMASGLGVGYNNIQFQFNNANASAQGAKDILQVVLQSMFAGLERDPVMFGWNWNSSEAYARIMYEEMVSGLKGYQLGVKRAIEHGHRLNLALSGFGDVSVSVSFHPARSIDAFRDAEADYMSAQAILAQLEAMVITPEEARKLLGHDDKQANAGEFVASFSRADNTYSLVPFEKTQWSGAEIGDGDREKRLVKIAPAKEVIERIQRRHAN